MTANPWVRPYVLTGGRTRTKHHLYVHTLVSVERYDPASATRLSPEARRIYERASFGAQSVAELSAHCGVSLGVTRVLLEDLVAAAGMYLKAILARGDAPFTREWMQQVFDGYWAHVQNSVTLTEMMLEPLPAHAQQVLGAAAQFQEIADKFAEVFPNPATIHDFLLDPAKAAAYVESVAAAR